MPRTGRRTSPQLDKLEQRVVELRRARTPDVIVVPVFANDDSSLVDAYVAQLDARFASMCAGTVIVSVTRCGERPPDLKPMWAAPRAWLDQGAAGVDPPRR